MTDDQKTTISEIRLVRVEYVAYFEARDQDGDPIGPPLAFSAKEGKPIVATGKAVATLHADLLAQVPKLLEDILRPLQDPPADSEA